MMVLRRRCSTPFLPTSSEHPLGLPRKRVPHLRETAQCLGAPEGCESNPRHNVNV
jgi:hypothetical protein